MSSVIVCPQCHQGNELGRIFCSRCGTKLDMTRMTRGNLGRSFDLPVFLRGAMRVVVCLVLLVLLLLLVWPTGLAGQRSGADEVTALLGQRQALAHAVQDKQAIKLEVSESALNAYLAATLKSAHSNEEAVSAWMLRLDELQVALRPEVVTVTARSQWGPLEITCELSGAPKVADGRFAVEAKSGRIGHLGLPRAGADWMAARMAVLFNRWSADRELLDQLAGVTTDTRTLVLATKGASP